MKVLSVSANHRMAVLHSDCSTCLLKLQLELQALMDYFRIVNITSVALGVACFILLLLLNFNKSS